MRTADARKGGEGVAGRGKRVVEKRRVRESSLGTKWSEMVERWKMNAVIVKGR